MHAPAASDHQSVSALEQSLLSADAVVGVVAVSIIGIVIIRLSARGVLG